MHGNPTLLRISYCVSRTIRLNTDQCTSLHEPRGLEHGCPSGSRASKLQSTAFRQLRLVADAPNTRQIDGTMQRTTAMPERNKLKGVTLVKRASAARLFVSLPWQLSNHRVRDCMASATPDLRLPSRPQSAALRRYSFPALPSRVRETDVIFPSRQRTGNSA